MFGTILLVVIVVVAASVAAYFLLRKKPVTAAKEANSVAPGEVTPAATPDVLLAEITKYRLRLALVPVPKSVLAAFDKAVMRLMTVLRMNLVLDQVNYAASSRSVRESFFRLVSAYCSLLPENAVAQGPQMIAALDNLSREFDNIIKGVEDTRVQDFRISGRLTEVFARLSSGEITQQAKPETPTESVSEEVAFPAELDRGLVQRYVNISKLPALPSRAEYRPFSLDRLTVGTLLMVDDNLERVAVVGEYDDGEDRWYEYRLEDLNGEVRFLEVWDDDGIYPVTTGKRDIMDQFGQTLDNLLSQRDISYQGTTYRFYEKAEQVKYREGDKIEITDSWDYREVSGDDLLSFERWADGTEYAYLMAFQPSSSIMIVFVGKE